MQRSLFIFLSVLMGVFLFACGEKNSLPQEERLPAKSDENHNMMLETPT